MDFVGGGWPHATQDEIPKNQETTREFLATYRATLSLHILEVDERSSTSYRARAMNFDLAALISKPSAASWRALKSCADEAEISAFEAWPDSLRLLRLPDEEALLSTRLGRLAVSFEIADDDATKVIRKLAKTSRTQVRRLSFHSCERLSEAVGKLEVFPNLVALDVTGEGATDEPDLAESIAPELPSLRELSLATEFAPIALTDADFWPSLRALHLVIGAADAVAIGALFSDGPPLETLDLEIARSFDSTHPLDLSGTLADTSSLRGLRSLGTILWTPTLAQVLDRFSRLSSLSLFATQVHEMPPNTTISHLTLRGPLGEEGRADCLRLFRGLPSPEALEIRSQ